MDYVFLPRHKLLISTILRRHDEEEEEVLVAPPSRAARKDCGNARRRRGPRPLRSGLQALAFRRFDDTRTPSGPPMAPSSLSRPFRQSDRPPQLLQPLRQQNLQPPSAQNSQQSIPRVVPRLRPRAGPPRHGEHRPPPQPDSPSPALPPFPPLPPVAHCAVQRWKLVTSSGSSIVMVSVAFGPILICEKRRGGEWGEWREISWVPICTRLEFAFHRGNYFVLDGGTGRTSLVDPRSLEVVSAIPSAQLGDHGLDRSDAPPPRCHYLVESSSQEELYLVAMSLRATEEGLFEVFRLDRGGVGGSGDRRWIKVRTIGEDMMFVDYRNAVALSARDFRGRKGSCIYFVDYGARVTCPRLFDIGSGGVEEVPHCWDDSRRRWKYHGWIIPTMM